MSPFVLEQKQNTCLLGLVPEAVRRRHRVPKSDLGYCAHIPRPSPLLNFQLPYFAISKVDAVRDTSAKQLSFGTIPELLISKMNTIRQAHIPTPTQTFK